MYKSRQPLHVVYNLLSSAMLLTPMMQPCWAQDTALTEPTRGILSPSSSVHSARATSLCPPFVGGHRDQLEASLPDDSITVTCTVERVDSLRDALGLQWRVVKYLTRYAFPADSIKRRSAPRDTTDTAEVLDVVLYSVDGSDSAWHPEWQGWAERRMVRRVDIGLGMHGGMAVFSVLSCVNGTGGCDQHFLGRVARKWVPLNERYHAQLERRFGGNAFWKGVVVDVRTLRGTVPLYSSGDANCCSSRELRLTLAIRGTAIVVESAEPRASR